MTMVRPHRIVHRGRVEASGFYFDAELIGMNEARRRILDLWKPGVQVYRNGARYYVRLLTSLHVDCTRSPGTPLVSAGHALSALPLTADELNALETTSASVVYASGGTACVALLHSSLSESPADWIDISGFEIIEVKSLGLTYEEPRLVTEPEPFDARQKLDGVPAATPELLETIAALKEGKGKGARAGRDINDDDGFLSDLKGSLVGSVTGTMLRLLAKFGKRTGSSFGQGGQGGQRGTGKHNDGAYDTDSSQKENFAGMLRRFAARLLHVTRLSGIVGRRQAAYMAKMMEMFERGDLEEALKHAIPLNDLPGSLRQSPALGVPSPRTGFAITPRLSRNSTAIGMGDDLMSYLRQLYRSSFDRLVAQHRIEEAAFVLAELLRNNEEAVAFLERHGKLRLAAELAEARELPAGLVVRQWFLAGEVSRAVRIARRTQAFADAVFRLEQRDRSQAAKLRLLWAESLVEAGNYATAVDVIWPLVDERHQAREWMDRVIEIGGPLAARMLARKLSLVPEDFTDVRDRALLFLEDESFEQRDARLSFAEALCQGERTSGTRALARATARAILRDAGQDSHAMQPKQFKSLLEFSGDGALRTDTPPFPTAGSASSGRASETLQVDFSAMDRGSTSIADAAFLGDGRMLVAMGEAGVRLLTRDGRTITHFDQPAHRLVLSEHGDRAIALARRGDVWRLARLDLLARRADDWCDAQLDAFAPDYDGTLWFIGAKGDFYAIDANAKSFDALWRVPEAGDGVVCVARSQSTCRFLTSDSSGLEKWVYQLPQQTLRNRTRLPAIPENVICMDLRVAFSSVGVFLDQSLYCSLGAASEPTSRWTASGTQEQQRVLERLPVLLLRVFDCDVVKHEFVIGDGNSQPGQPAVVGSVAVSPVYLAEGARVRVFDLQDGSILAELFLSKSTHVSTRLTEKTLTIADDCGRLLVLDLVRNCLIRNLRV
jgi:MoxR-vWA-beta-propeller ternary system domain bpX6